MLQPRASRFRRHRGWKAGVIGRSDESAGSRFFVGSLMEQRVQAIGRQVPLVCLADQLAGAGEEGVLFHLDRGGGFRVDAQRTGSVLLQDSAREERGDGVENFVKGHMAGAGQIGRLRERIAGLGVTLDEGNDHRTDQLPGPVVGRIIHG